MSYDVCLHKLIKGNNASCTPEEASACLRVLNDFSTSYGPDNILLKTGEHLEVSLWEDEEDISGCTFYFRGGKLNSDFIFELAKVGNFAILDTGGEGTREKPVAIFLSEASLDYAGRDTFKNPYVCSDKTSLKALLNASYDAWMGWSDKLDAKIASRNSTISKDAPKPGFWQRLFGQK